MRRPFVLIAVAGLAALATTTGATSASAASPPVTGSVTCAVSADSTFTPALGYTQGLAGKHVSPNANTKWRLEGTLAGCTGTQAGGNPRFPGPIATGDLLIRAKGVTHSCAAMTANGMEVRSARVRWYDALGNRKGTTKATGTATVDGLFDGSPFLSFNPPVLWPGYVPPGLFTFTVNAVGKTTSKAFPGEAVTITAVADETLAMIQVPCSFTAPPLSGGMAGFGFHGTNGAATLGVS
jgi:hypothetical protein